MTPALLQKLAYTVECFFNATRTPDGAERVRHEAWLVDWLKSDAARTRFAVYQGGSVFCHEGAGKAVSSFPLRQPVQGKTIWCDGRRVSMLDGVAFSRDGRLVMLGTAGLVLTMPGVAGAQAKDARKADLEISRDSNNNNNNNNNNNS